MSYQRVTGSLIALVIALSTAVPAQAQGLRDMQLFAPYNETTYGGMKKANEGFFFGFDTLVWSISTPDATTIGEYSEQGRVVWYGPNPEDTATQNNSHDTSIFTTDFVTGQRYEGGFIHGHQGLLFSAWRLNPQDQQIPTTHMTMVFDDQEWGGPLDYLHLDGYVDDLDTIIRPLPVSFATADIRNRVETWGLELMYMLRTNQTHNGGYFEFFGGARYLEFNDRFSLEAYGNLVPVTISGETVDGVVIIGYDEEGFPNDPDADQVFLYVGSLANSFWYQDADNRIVGPQIGARWFKSYGRWTLSTEGRFFAGYNAQSLRQTGTIASELNPNTGLLNEPSLPGHIPEANVPLALEATSFMHTRHKNEFTPGVELRLNLEWQWTRNISFGAGWTGLWMDNIARSSNLIDYQFGTSSLMGILADNNRQDVFIHGANFRIQLNR
ncbi:MAG: BBP7 family outer membrane beta-barrel protein [Pirellulaceae bacterium]|nr:BBP7 family outer membrane beta-barrel protein [Pirellulaceae bacterium]